jgi:addiction module HigA family antidote
MTRMHNPPHPGAVLQDTVLRADGGITITEFAERLRVSRVALSRGVNGHAAISAERAIRLAPLSRGCACRLPTICGMRRRRNARRSPRSRACRSSARTPRRAPRLAR